MSVAPAAPDVVLVPKAEEQLQVKQDLLAVNEAILVTDLDPPKKRMLQLRVNGLLAEYLFRCRVYSFTFHGLRITTTIGSLIVPALLSVQYVNGNVSTQSATIGVQVYWTVWILSLFVTVCNGLLNLMKIDKKYYMIHTCYQHLLSEVWQYLQLSGKYSGLYTQGEPATHLNQYIYICNMLEKIRMKHIEEEYYKVLEQATSRQAESLIPPTPFKVSVEENSTPPVNGETTLRKITRQIA